MAGLCELQLLIVAALVKLQHFINWQFWCVRFTKKMSDKFNTVALINTVADKKSSRFVCVQRITQCVLFPFAFSRTMAVS